MKVAFLGNMNNNNFSLMRYFRDLGVDAHLLPFANDGVGTLTHFTPENDTWDIEKWRPYIHPMDIANSLTSIVGSLKKLRLPPTKRQIEKLISGYDVFIGSGLVPAILGRVGLGMDIFYPYGIGIEYVGTHEHLKKKRVSYLKELSHNYVRQKQIEGIRNARHCINSDMSITKKTFEEMGKGFHSLAIPMVYNREEVADAQLSSRVCSLREKIEGFDFKIFSHARLLWAHDPSYTLSEWEQCSKHNNWLIIGYAEFVKRFPESASILVLVEFGPDVTVTRQLCADIGIEDKVLWLPKMPRKEIMYLLGLCDVGVGQFYMDHGAMWGGTGWEVLASGKPLLQRFNFSEKEFIDIFGHEPPPILNAKSPESITMHLIDVYLNKDKSVDIGRASKAWFDKNNGIGLAKKWLELLAADSQ